MLEALGCIAALCVVLPAQSVITGSTVYNAQIDSNFATYTNIYVVFPPAYGSNNYGNFLSSVMTQGAIDGVTLQVNWNQIETSDPTTTPCSPVGTDTCQQDQSNVSYYHRYGWSTLDGLGCADTDPNSIFPWFCQGGRKVNFILTGVSGPPTNIVTPTYVTHNQTWIAAVNPTYQHQDVVNASNTLFMGATTCSGYTGSISVPSGGTFAGDTSNPAIVAVTWSGSSPHPNDGDTIWVSGFTLTHAPLNNVTQFGSIVTTHSSLPSCPSAATFCYMAPGPANLTAFGTGASIVNSVDSWPVPYEESFAAGYLAFLKAAIYHFNTLNNLDSISGVRESVSQIRYIRPGLAVGGEAQPICPSSNVMSHTMPGYSEPEWVGQTTPTVGWYRRVAQTVQSASPLMQIMYSINVEGTTHEVTFATDEAALAITYGNVTGILNGFGSQGLAQADIGFDVTQCPNNADPPQSGNNWACMFTKYWSGANPSEYNTGHDSPQTTTVGLELQQIDCSNPCAAGACAGYPGGSEICFLGGVAPGQTGDLRTLLPVVTGQHHASIIELYSKDALLAFDPMYCHPNSGTHVCDSTSGYDTFSDLTAASQYYFYESAGQGACSPGNCYAADAINKSHGPH